MTRLTLGLLVGCAALAAVLLVRWAYTEDELRQFGQGGWR